MTKYYRGFKDLNFSSEIRKAIEIEHLLNTGLASIKRAQNEYKLLRLIRNSENFDEFVKLSGIEPEVAQEYWAEYWS